MLVVFRDGFCCSLATDSSSSDQMSSYPKISYLRTRAQSSPFYDNVDLNLLRRRKKVLKSVSYRYNQLKLINMITHEYYR